MTAMTSGAASSGSMRVALPEKRAAGDVSLGKGTEPAAHCTADRHGTRAAYVRGCRCPEARDANRRYANWRDKRLIQAKYGAAEPLSVPAEQTCSVIEQLRGVGWSLRRIEAETGIGRDHLQRILGRTRRPLRRVRLATHRTLSALAEREVVVPDGALVDARETWRLIRGLIALGYPKAWIAQQINGGRALQLDEYVVTARNARKVRELADSTITAGPSDAARRYAAARGWSVDLLLGEGLEPFEADDVDPVAVQRAVAGDPPDTLTKAERREAVRILHGRGHSYSEIAQRLGTHDRMVHRDLTALGLVGQAVNG